MCVRSERKAVLVLVTCLVAAPMVQSLLAPGATSHPWVFPGCLSYNHPPSSPSSPAAYHPEGLELEGTKRRYQPNSSPQLQHRCVTSAPDYQGRRSTSRSLHRCVNSAPDYLARYIYLCGLCTGVSFQHLTTSTAQVCHFST